MTAMKIKIVVQVLADDMYVAAFESDLRKSAHGPNQEGAIINLLRLHGGHLFEMEVVDHRPACPAPEPSSVDAHDRVAIAQKKSGLSWAEAERALHAGFKVRPEGNGGIGWLQKDSHMLPHWAMYAREEERPVPWPLNVPPPVVARVMASHWEIVE